MLSGEVCGGNRPVVFFVEPLGGRADPMGVPALDRDVTEDACLLSKQGSIDDLTQPRRSRKGASSAASGRLASRNRAAGRTAPTGKRRWPGRCCGQAAWRGRIGSRPG